MNNRKINNIAKIEKFNPQIKKMLVIGEARISTVYEVNKTREGKKQTHSCVRHGGHVINNCTVHIEVAVQHYIL